MGIHVFEHFHKYECIEILTNYLEILKPGGALIIEMPNLSALKWMTHLPRIKKYDDIPTSINIIDSQFYGASWEKNSKGYPYHKYVWGRKEFGLMLEEIGYEIRLSTKATLHHYPLRDFCIIAQKPLGCTINDELEVDKMIKIYGSSLKRLKRMIVSLMNICQCI